MKKNFTTFFIFTAMMLMVLSGCGEDIQVPNSTNDGEINPTGERMTVFSSSSDGTRTSIDTNAKFYWEAGDYIWVDTLKNGTYTGKSHSIELSNPTKAPSAKFYFRQIILTEPKYDLTYTGNNSSSGTSVTIATRQTQTGWNNAAHLGASGDCGVAEATRDNSTGIYSFSLKHKASYLIFQPYRAASISDGWKLKSIEIISDNTVAGTYPFNKTDGIVTTSTITNPSDTIRLICDGNSDFTLPQSAYSEDNSCYMVIQPGTHKLTVRYEIQPTGSVNGVADSTFYITKEVETTFKANGVRKIRHELTATSYSTNLFYMWDATVGEYFWKGVSNPPTVMGTSKSGYPTSASDSRWYNTTYKGAYVPVLASRSCKDMPSANMMSWYAMAGDPRWDDGIASCLNGDYANIAAGGAWILKRQYICENEGITETYMNSVSCDCSSDLRSSSIVPEDRINNYRNTSSSYTSGGRPAASELDKYFFLPGLGHIFSENNIPNGIYKSTGGQYWSSTSLADGLWNGYKLGVRTTSIYVGYNRRFDGLIVAPDWFQ